MAGSKRILLVEDEQLISEMYGRVIERAGFELDYAINGHDGIIKAKKNQYDLILLDIMMPGMSGIDVLRNLRGEDGKGLGDTKIVILTNLAQDKASREALEAKADGYLIKADVVPSKLTKIINKLI
jgi:DNA-binding response OmpR family regulator